MKKLKKSILRSVRMRNVSSTNSLLNIGSITTQITQSSNNTCSCVKEFFNVNLCSCFKVFPNTNFKNPIVDPASFECGYLINANFEKVTFNSDLASSGVNPPTNFKGALLINAKFNEATFNSFNSVINFRNADLRNASFAYATFNGDVDFTGADLTGTSFTNATYNGNVYK